MSTFSLRSTQEGSTLSGQADRTSRCGEHCALSLSRIARLLVVSQRPKQSLAFSIVNSSSVSLPLLSDKDRASQGVSSSVTWTAAVPRPQSSSAVRMGSGILMNAPHSSWTCNFLQSTVALSPLLLCAPHTGSQYQRAWKALVQTDHKT